ncbi:replication endonuclease [Alteromonas lipotrueae]|uniref:replication endonuclease n=1 Tax=Alteromonas lipotrueae TaxID=2803814 RepID=UPI001C45CDAC|nr:replication endonuclease [Alteromonas lipotrueae]
MKVEVCSLGVFIEVPNLTSKREAERVGYKLLAFTRDSVLPRFPIQYQKRAARVFADIYQKNLESGKGTPVFQCVKNANAALIKKSHALKNALCAWRLPLNALYATETREREKRALLLAARRIASECDGDALETYRIAGKMYAAAGVQVPPLSKEEKSEGEKSNIVAIVNRLLCEEWVDKKVERLGRLCRENVAIAWGEVTPKTPYISNGGLKAYRAQVAAGEQFLSSVLLVNDELEETVLLKDAAEKGASNTRIREIELNVRVDGLTEWAERSGLDAYFLTMTAPSKYHYNSGKNWCGAMPRDVQSRLVEVWALARAKLSKHGISFRGFRVVEPHKDACPHWHMLIFFTPEQSAAALKVIGDEFCKEDADELNTPKKRRARFDVVKLENAKHAARYVAKYISKNLDGESMAKGVKSNDPFDNETDLDIVSAAERVRAWSSFHAIRQFQFFGIESITVFREIRRLRITEASEEIQQLIDATGGTKDDEKVPDWYAFEKLAHKCELIKETDTARYGEEMKRIKGIVINGAEFVTRVGVWVQEQVTPARSEALKTGDSLFTWKVVDNCNHAIENCAVVTDNGVIMATADGILKLRVDEV